MGSNTTNVQPNETNQTTEFDFIWILLLLETFGLIQHTK